MGQERIWKVKRLFAETISIYKYEKSVNIFLSPQFGNFLKTDFCPQQYQNDSSAAEVKSLSRRRIKV